MKLWYHSKSGKAPGSNNGTSPANAWNHRQFWTVARKFIKFIPVFLLIGCQSPKVVKITPNPPKAIELPSISQAIVVPRQPAGYEVNMAGGTLVIITNGPNKGSQIFFGTSQQPTWTTLHCLKAASITVQGSNDLANWSDLWTTNAPDFYFKFDPKYLFYRTKS